MANAKELLEVLIKINAVSNDQHLDFGEKLQHIILDIVRHMRVKSGSIMLVKGSQNIKVVASTNTELIGIKQSLDQESPSSWVCIHKDILYVEDISTSDIFPARFEHYEGCALLLAPFIVKNKVIGIIAVTDKIGEDYFPQEEQKSLLILAGHVIGALENQRLT
ncbi:MAG: GAF domain-containing protein, partial [Candidatus Desulfatibia sp.]|uniref:GAF domain-containing protein n=1 Tax=Candidatus Desulfatibia sp. TaxID=3101189 RepID=UPI002F2E8E3C